MSENLLPGRASWKRKLVGFLLLFLGVLGVLLPILQGTVFLMLGVFVLRDQYAWSRRALAWCARRWPRQMGGLAGLERKLLSTLRGWGKRVRRLRRSSGS